MLQMKIFKVVTDYKPTACIDCDFMCLRSNPDEYPQACALTDEDIIDTEGSVPDSCPIVSIEKEE